jgi:hypothetical protein
MSNNQKRILIAFHNIAIKIMLEDGHYQVISQVSSMDNIALALTSFDILVPLQPFGKFDEIY